MGGATVNIHNVEVEFPYEPYECQLSYMQKVVEALDTCGDAVLESPTGTGKTLSLLCATLGWIKQRKSQLGPSLHMAMDPTQKVSSASLVPRVFYCSRTHSQLSQVVRELNKTKYMDVKVCTLGSRDQLCVHEQVSREKDSRTKALKCRNLVAKRSCHYYNQWNAMDMQSLDALYGEDKKVLDIEDLAKAGKKHKQCPFFRSRQQQETAELILLPYNYLIDPHLRQIHKIDLKGNIVIFDEAHNLEGVCEESVSTALSTADIAFTIKELQSALEFLHTRNEEIRAEMDNTTAEFGDGLSKEKKKEKELNLKAVADILEKMFELETKMDELWSKGVVTETLNEDPSKESKVFAGRSMIDLLEKSGFRKENAVEYSEVLHKVATTLAEEKGEEDKVAIKEAGHKLLEFGSFLCRVFADSFEAMSRRAVSDKDVAGEHFKVYAVKEGTKITFNYWCMTAGIAMRFLKSRGVLTMIVTSGTLAPLEQFTRNLGIPFPVTLQNKHAAKPSQVTVLCVSKGADGSTLCGTYANRDTAAYLTGVGEGVLRTVENTPDGVLVFFASYSAMNGCIERWKQPGGRSLSIWESIRRRKEIVVEPKNKIELNAVRFAFNNAVATKNGAVFFAVCRGKISEGIDFADRHSRAVVIVGIPFPPLHEPKVVLKRSHLNEINCKDRTTMSGQEWYTMEGTRAVNQAIGRVLRHVNDYGAVVLLDSRFSTAALSSFPCWLQQSLERGGEVSAMEKSLRTFFGRWNKGGGGGGGVKQENADPLGITDKRGKTIRLPTTMATSMEPQGIRDIASEYTSAPIDRSEEERERERKLAQPTTKGFLSRALSSNVPSTSSSSGSTPPSSTLKRPLPLAPTALLDPAALATRPTSSLQRPPAKKYKVVSNLRMDEAKVVKAEGKSEYDGLPVERFQQMLKDANLLPAFKRAARAFRENKNEQALVQSLTADFLPEHHKLLKASMNVFPAPVQRLIKNLLEERGLYYI